MTTVTDMAGLTFPHRRLTKLIAVVALAIALGGCSDFGRYVPQVRVWNRTGQ